MTYQTGRRAAVHTARTMRSALALARTLDPLGTPPVVPRDWRVAVDATTSGDWGMLGNDAAGDCTCADTAHALMLRSANTGTLIQPTVTDAIAAYSAITGYVPGNVMTDNGAAETDVCAYNQRVGMLGHKSSTWGSLDPKNLNHIKWCVELFGSCRLGILVDSDMIQQFETGTPWTAPAARPEGHDVPVVYYDADYAYVITWGREQRIAWNLMSNPAFLDEAHSELFYDWIRAQGGSPSGANLDLNLLAQYMAEVDA